MKKSFLGFICVLALGLISACGQAASTPTPTAAPAATTAPTIAPTAASHAAMGDMDMTAMPEMDAAPYDAQFIDSMIEHHQGAIAMANQALKSAEHEEIKAMAQAIVSAQQGEIDKMQAWRAEWYPDLASTSGMGMAMGEMQVGDDASVPFDQRFITAMIAHHQGAVAMAKDAQQHAEHAEIKSLADAIVAAQEGEIAQMQGWQKAWYGK